MVSTLNIIMLKLTETKLLFNTVYNKKAKDAPDYQP
jgi:hypothetical protein